MRYGNHAVPRRVVVQHRIYSVPSPYGFRLTSISPDAIRRSEVDKDTISS